MGTPDGLIVYLGGAVLCSVAAFFVAFFHRTAAKVVAGLCVGMLVLFCMGVWEFNITNRWWLLTMLRTPSIVTAMVYGSLAVALVAAFAPLRRQDTVTADGTVITGGPRWKLFTAAALPLILWAGYEAKQIIDERRGERQAAALLAGDPTVRLNRFQIDFRQGRVVCTDPEVLRYVEEQFRHATDPRFDTSASYGTYELSLSFDGGDTCLIPTGWSTTGDVQLHLTRSTDREASHQIRLTRPRPPAVDQLLDFLAQDYRQTAGWVLILEPGGPRRERDESLVAK